jgi:hypothetical protein
MLNFILSLRHLTKSGCKLKFVYSFENSFKPNFYSIWDLKFFKYKIHQINYPIPTNEEKKLVIGFSFTLKIM